MRAWKFQDSRQAKQLGEKKAPWSVGWYDPEGRRRSKKIGGKSMAEKFSRKLEGQLAAGTYQDESRKKWKDFRSEYESKIMPGHAIKTRESVAKTLDHFERIAKPIKLISIKTATIDEFIAKRRLDPGRKKKSTVSPATINHDLRHLKAILNVAHDWGYLPKAPKFRHVREAELIGPVVSQEHFHVIYDAVDVATMPRGLHVPPASWWQALLVFAITTGWRIDEILSFRRDDLNLDTGEIITRAADNKGNRDDIDHLPGAAIDHIRGIVGFSPYVFPWPHNIRTLWTEFRRIQRAAGINLPCPDAGKHVCSEACHAYGFHALRRAYATLNADTMSASVLQKKMRHRSFNTTQRYIALADKMKGAAEKVFVPEFLKDGKAG